MLELFLSRNNRQAMFFLIRLCQKKCLLRHSIGSLSPRVTKIFKVHLFYIILGLPKTDVVPQDSSIFLRVPQASSGFLRVPQDSTVIIWIPQGFSGFLCVSVVLHCSSELQMLSHGCSKSFLRFLLLLLLLRLLLLSLSLCCYSCCYV